MNSSELTHKNRNQMIFAWNWDRNLFGDKQSTASTYDVFLQRIEGADPSLERALPSASLQKPFYPVDSLVLTALDALMSMIASTNRGPTRTSRIGYLWFFTLCSAFNWISITNPIQGVKDNWDWTIEHPLTNDLDVYLWIVSVLDYVMPTFIIGYNTSTNRQQGLAFLNLTTEKLEEELIRIRVEGRWDLWTVAWNLWYTARTSDGSVAAAVVPSNDLLPNGAQTLEVTTTTDNPNTFSQPQKWVPLTIHGSKKNYLTFGWGSVRSTGLTVEHESTILVATQAFFPGTASSTTDGSVRANEIADLVNVNATLTDTQKMSAEFWAGGPNTVSPPGMFLLFWGYYVIATDTAKTFGLTKFFFSGFDLAIQLFETSRLVWQSKKDNFQARPIQEIRRMYRGQTLTSYDGTSILGEAWIPFQESNFVSPPFPDFPSGHSAFSQSFANCMSSWFGQSIDPKEVSMNNIQLLSPIFQSPQKNLFGTFRIPAQSSLIQVGVMPSSTLNFIYRTWQEIANDAGISRKYGGIHATSAHTSSQALANSLYTQLQSVWNISRSS